MTIQFVPSEMIKARGVDTTRQQLSDHQLKAFGVDPAIQQLSDWQADVPDPYFGDVVLLLHGDGAEGSTTITDIKGHTVTTSGSVELRAANANFGTASINNLTSTSHVICDHADLVLGTADFTVEWWARHTQLKGAPFFSGNPFVIQETGAPAGSYNGYVSYVHSDGVVYASFPLGRGVFKFTMAFPALNAWHHWALSREGNTLRMFLDGELLPLVEITASNPTTNDIVGSKVMWGCVDTYGLFGQMEELRITKGVARYTATFVAPTRAFPDV